MKSIKNIPGTMLTKQQMKQINGGNGQAMQFNCKTETGGSMIHVNMNVKTVKGAEAELLKFMERNPNVVYCQLLDSLEEAV